MGSTGERTLNRWWTTAFFDRTVHWDPVIRLTLYKPMIESCPALRIELCLHLRKIFNERFWHKVEANSLNEFLL
jgi:hypothetical protein